MVKNEDSVQALNVFLSDVHVGNLYFDGAKYSFRYEESYLRRQQKIPVSLSLPLNDETHYGPMGGKELPLYFFHILPEGWLLSLAKSLKMPVNSPMDLLALLCVDTIGAIKLSKTPTLQNELESEVDQTEESLLLESNPGEPTTYPGDSSAGSDRYRQANE